MKGSHSEHWYGETENRTGSKMPSKPQLTQQRKPTWLVECNCPTHRSWQSDKAVTPVLRRTWLKTNKGQGNNPQRNPKGKLHRTKPWERKGSLPGGATKNQVPMYRSRVRRQSEPMEWHQITCGTDQIRDDQEESATRSTPIKPNKGSALPSKGKQRKDQAPIKSKH